MCHTSYDPLRLDQFEHMACRTTKKPWNNTFSIPNKISMGKYLPRPVEQAPIQFAQHLKGQDHEKPACLPWHDFGAICSVPKRGLHISRNRLLGWACIALVLSIISGTIGFGEATVQSTHFPRTAFITFLLIFVLLLVLTTVAHEKE
jgi:uncharacterized membrane protein YtjA (UPF0391 family)